MPTKLELDSQLDVLKDRGEKNGAKVELWDESQLQDFFPEARTASGRAIWSPNTCVVKPKEILRELESELCVKGLEIIKKNTLFAYLMMVV